MERINYRITLDAFKGGIQRRLQGFETSDNMSRRISISLVSGGEDFKIPKENVMAMMYVMTPGAEEPSINACTIDGNTIIYDVLPIMVPGVTKMQMKLVEVSTNGAKSVLVSPKFAVEVSESSTNDETAEQTVTFTALEDAVAKAKAVYDVRLLGITVSDDGVFRAEYADGTVYETDALQKLMFSGDYRMSKSYAVGGSGIRDGEDTDNAKYYCEEAAKNVNTYIETILEEDGNLIIRTSFVPSGEV